MNSVFKLGRDLRMKGDPVVDASHNCDGPYVTFSYTNSFPKSYFVWEASFLTNSTKTGVRGCMNTDLGFALPVN